jgi:large subunit ribosomal protein L30
MAKSKIEQLRVTLVKSPAGRLAKHQACVRGLGLRRMQHSVTIAATPENLGMVRKVSYLLQVEEI